MLECEHQDASLKLLKPFLKREECAIRAKRKESGKTYLGAQACKNTPIFDSPNTPPKVNVDEDGNITPKVSCGSGAIKKKLLNLIEIFVNEYKECLKNLKAGIKDIVFPAGTYRMKSCFEQEVAQGELSDVMMGLSSG